MTAFVGLFIVIEVKLSQLKKPPSPISDTDGRDIDVKFQADEKAFKPMVITAGISTYSSVLHPSKQPFPRYSTDGKLTEVKAVHSIKQLVPMLSMLEDRDTDVKDSQKEKTAGPRLYRPVNPSKSVSSIETIDLSIIELISNALVSSAANALKSTLTGI